MALTRIPTPPFALGVEDDVLSSILFPFFIAEGTYAVSSDEFPARVGGAGPGPGPNPPQVSVWALPTPPPPGRGPLRMDPCAELFEGRTKSTNPPIHPSSNRTGA